jgi:archaellum biogenesis ATPase FlaH
MSFDEAQLDRDLVSMLSGEINELKRKMANMYVTNSPPGVDDTPQRILFDAAGKSPTEMLAAYKAKMAAFDTTPLDVEGESLRFYRGQWTIFSGYTGTGKTTMLRQQVCHWLNLGASVFVATLEQDPEDYIIELASTAAGVPMVDERQLTAFLDAYGAKLHLWGMIGVAEHKKILAAIRMLAKGGLDYAVIDSLMVLDVDSQDFEAQREFAALLNATVIASKVHVMLVAHPKKPLDPEASPSTNDVAGSSNLANLAYNVLFIRRGPPQPGYDGKVTAMELHVLKQRTYGRIGVIEGCFYREQNQFHRDAGALEPIRYLDDSFYPATGLSDTIPEHILNPNAFRVEPASTNVDLPPWEV